ncbi:hypothetical protein M5689_008625 [Euphorbia peplus]|nr:hypothetical protein M5689_008625 [Euphorbia peplus]
MSNFIFICHSGGEFQSTNDGSLVYVGGDTHAIKISSYYPTFLEFRQEVASVFNCSADSISGFKYSLPHQKGTFVTISNDMDLSKMRLVQGKYYEDLRAIKQYHSYDAYVDIYLIRA